MKRKSTRCIATLLGLVLVASCGSSSPKSTTRPLTQQEASTLAQSAFLNYEKGGAQFEVTTVVAPGQGRLMMSGMIDWSQHVGVARVQAAVSTPTLTEVAWMSNAIAERRPSLDAQVQKFGAAAPYFLIRKPDMNRRIDQVASVLMGLAAEQPENAQLILQKEGSAFLRDDVLNNKPVVVLRFGNHNVYWIEKSTGLLLRFEGSNAAGTQQIVILLSGHGKPKIGFPAQKYWIDAEKNKEVMQLTSGF